MVVIILALLIIWPIAELFAMYQVADSIGFFWMLTLLFLSTVAGILVLRHRGRAAWARLRGAVSERRPPAKEAFDGVMVTAAGLLLIIPGFFTSAFGLLLLFPPTRYVLRWALLLVFASKYRVAATSATWGARGYGSYRDRPGSRSEYDVEGEAVDVTDYPADPSSTPQLPSPESETKP